MGFRKYSAETSTSAKPDSLAFCSPVPGRPALLEHRHLQINLAVKDGQICLLASPPSSQRFPQSCKLGGAQQGGSHVAVVFAFAKQRYKCCQAGGVGVALQISLVGALHQVALIFRA